VFPIKLLPGDLVEIEKASFILCCSRQAVSHEWIGRALDRPFLFGLIINEGEKSFMEIDYDDEWISTDKEQKIMYKVYVLGKIVQLDERSFGGKL
jgi:hypothetical protein